MSLYRVWEQYLIFPLHDLCNTHYSNIWEFLTYQVKFILLVHISEVTRVKEIHDNFSITEDFSMGDFPNNYVLVTEEV